MARSFKISEYIHNALTKNISQSVQSEAICKYHSHARFKTKVMSVTILQCRLTKCFDPINYVTSKRNNFLEIHIYIILHIFNVISKCTQTNGPM